MVLYADLVMATAVRQWLAEPPVPNPPRRVWRDWIMVGLLVPAAIAEVVLRDDLGWPAVAFILGVIPMFGLLWRRTHPLAVIIVVFVAHAASHVITVFGASYSAMLYTSAWIAILPYALFRWASGRHCAIGLGLMLALHVPMGSGGISAVGDTIAAAVFFLLPAALGAAMRFRSTSKWREVEQIKMQEREQLARELHDTVAHHVSAIIIQAQAGRTVGGSNPGAALSALEVIEAEATRTLGEMRIMVGALRHGEGADLAPTRGVTDIGRLASNIGDGPPIDVQLSGDLDNLGPSVGAALYRLAQEAITNSVRHARHATRIDVNVTADARGVRLTVHDDGEANPFGASPVGYGIIGMTERAKLLGGSLAAGQDPTGGWTVSAHLPREDVRA
jgi:signal transduction histidine kinase